MGAIYLIRHGQASFGAIDYDHLSPIGERQAQVLGAALAPRLQKVDRVLCGTLRRQVETAGRALQAAGVELAVERDPVWNEFDHEDVLRCHEPDFADPPRIYARIAAEADPRAAFERLFRDAILRWVGGAHDADYQESWSAFRSRCAGALDALVNGLGPSRTALVFTSGGPIAMITAHLLGISVERAMELPAKLTNCGVTKVVYGQRGVHLSSFNEHAWFEGASAELLSYR